MRILYFHQHFSTPKGSAGIRSYEMAQRLIKHGHSVTMVCGSYAGGETELSSSFLQDTRCGCVNGINIIEFNLTYSNSDGLLKRSMTFLKFAFRSVKLVFTEEYDIVFATTTPLTAGVPGIFARWFRKKPFVFEVRDLWPELPRAMGVIKNPLVLWAMSILEWTSYRSAHRLIGLSPGIVEGIKKCGVVAERIALVPNGCDLEIFRDTSGAWRPDGVTKDDFIAVFTGTHGLANGLDSVLDAAAELKRRNQNNIKLVLIGQGRLKPQLVKRAEDEGLDNVVFCEPVNKEKLSGLMASADIGMQILANVPAFYYGTSPNKFFDYIAAGLPVIINYPGWLAKLISENNCGFAVPPENRVAFADALEQASKDKEVLSSMGESGRILAEAKFSRTKLADDFVSWVAGTPRMIKSIK